MLFSLAQAIFVWRTFGRYCVFLIRGSTVGLFIGGSGAASSGHFRPILRVPGSGPEVNKYIFNSFQKAAKCAACDDDVRFATAAGGGGSPFRPSGASCQSFLPTWICCTRPELVRMHSWLLAPAWAYLCYAIVLPGRKSGFRADIRPGSTFA